MPKQYLTVSYDLDADLSFYPSWEVLPHETRLPHADVISERLETLVHLTQHQHATRHTCRLSSPASWPAPAYVSGGDGS